MPTLKKGPRPAPETPRRPTHRPAPRPVLPEPGHHRQRPDQRAAAPAGQGWSADPAEDRADHRRQRGTTAAEHDIRPAPGKLRAPSLQTVLAFAQACGASDNGLKKWRDAWARAMNPEPQPPRNDHGRPPRLLSKRQMRDLLLPLIEGYNRQLSDFARETNTSIDAIRDVLTARRRPSAQFARDLAHATGTPAEQLLTDLGWLPGLPQGGPS